MMDRALVRESARRRALQQRRAARPPASPPPAPSGAAAPSEEAAALALFARLGTTEWMPRRVEEVCLVGQRMLLRRVHVTVKIDGTGEETLVPIGRFSKGRTRRERVFMVRDEEDKLVPVLTPAERDRAVEAALLAAAARLIGPERKPTIDSLIADAVREPDDKEARKHLNKLTAELELHAGEPAQGLPATNAETFRKLIKTVARQWLLLVPVCADEKLHQFTYEYLQTTDVNPRGDEKLWHGIAARLGWRPTKITMGMSGMVLSPVSYGIFEAPDSLALVDTRVRRPPAKEEEGWGDASRQQVYVESPAPTGQPEVVVRLRPRPDGLVRNGFIVGFLISALLVGGAVFHEQLKQATSQADAATALLLAVPSFFLLDAARSSEHRFIARTLWPIQVALLTTGLAAFFAAILMLSSNDKMGPPLLPWQVLAGIACLGTLSLFIAYRGGDALAWVASLLREQRQRVLEWLAERGLRRSAGNSEV